MSEPSRHSTEEKAVNENEFSSKSSAGSSINNHVCNSEIDVNTNLDSHSMKIINNTLDEDIYNSSNKNNFSVKNNKAENDKDNEKVEDLCVVSTIKAFKTSLSQTTPKSKEQILSEVNQTYIDIHQNEENISSANQNKNSNYSNTVINSNNLNKNINESSASNINNNNIINNKASLNPELQYLIDSGKSDPRSSIISSTSCSVSPNISYNQEIENHPSNINGNIITANCKETFKNSEFSEKRRSIYTKRDISRFDFVLNNTSNNANTNKNIENTESRKSSDNNKENETLDEEIPEFVFDVLNKKISRFSFFKRFKNEYDIPDSIFLEECFIDKNKDESWADFIKMNLNV